MSWSIDMTGRPENVAMALEAHHVTIEHAQSRQEYRDAAPHLIGLVARIFEREKEPHVIPPLVRVRASGTGRRAADGAELSSSITVTIEPIYTRLV